MSPSTYISTKVTLHSQNVAVSTYIHWGLSIWVFGISYAFLECVTTGNQALLHNLPYFYGDFNTFL